jgi:hypothetical protein
VVQYRHDVGEGAYWAVTVVAATIAAMARDKSFILKLR